MNRPAPLPQWFMSFTHNGQFRGALVVIAEDLPSAVTVTRLTGLNPGGHVTTLELPADTVGPRWTFVLLDAEQARALPKPSWSPDDFRHRLAAAMTDPPTAGRPRLPSRHDRNPGQSPGQPR